MKRHWRFGVMSVANRSKWLSTAEDRAAGFPSARRSAPRLWQRSSRRHHHKDRLRDSGRARRPGGTCASRLPADVSGRAVPSRRPKVTVGSPKKVFYEDVRLVRGRRQILLQSIPSAPHNPDCLFAARASDPPARRRRRPGLPTTGARLRLRPHKIVAHRRVQGHHRDCVNQEGARHHRSRTTSSWGDVGPSKTTSSSRGKNYLR